ncbi:hypothetical protein BIV57_03320 [Mangrovactinospora gilvigrisea]|uniref:Uncharacterized protein n=1 Tax=Mangrovactinospora gilvigrisea TaxID=1428644 RepID=A0A1J7BJU7_9ACTN|nr:hypothetical protein [Mangrovactinospora gilvigrisea]OIV38910.1 hypothetical protein BIV57_03320 [Mangrovactinospora gilvigrisea]
MGNGSVDGESGGSGGPERADGAGRTAAAAADDVLALLSDLLPVLAPHALLDREERRLVLLVDGAHATVDLEPLLSACRGRPQHTWPRRVEEWLAATAEGSAAALRERRRLGGDVESRLRVRLVPPLPGPERRRLMCLPYGPLLDVVIHLDHPAEPGPLSRERAVQLALADPGEAAITGTLRREVPTFSVHDEPLGGTGEDGDRVRVVARDGNPYVTGVLFDLERFVPAEERPRGLLVGLPCHSRVLLYAVRGEALLRVAPVMAAQVREEFDAAPDGCDPRLFWWHEDRLYELRRGRLTGRPRVPWALRSLLR